MFGFHRDFVGGAPPEFAILSRHGLAIMLRRIPAPDAIRPNEKQGGTWDVMFFWVLDAEALYAQLKATGADILVCAGRRRDPGMTSLNELVDALRATTGCLGVEAARTLTGKSVIFAWVEDKAAVLRRYSGTVHQAGIKTVYTSEAEREPLRGVANDTGPLLIVASLTSPSSDSPEMLRQAGHMNHAAAALGTAAASRRGL